MAATVTNSAQPDQQLLGDVESQTTQRNWNNTRLVTRDSLSFGIGFCILTVLAVGSMLASGSDNPRVAYLGTFVEGVVTGSTLFALFTSWVRANSGPFSNI